MDSKGIRAKLVKRHCGLFLRATDLDRWGKEEDAIKAYSRIKDELVKEMEKPTVYRTDEQLILLKNIITCIEMRMLLIQSIEYGIGIPLEDLMKLKPVLRNFFAWKGPFPLLLHSNEVSEKNSQKLRDNENYVKREDYEAEGFLLPPIPSLPRLNRLTVRVMKIGIKDAASLIAPTIVVHLKDNVAVSLTPAQETPVARMTEPFYLYFGADVEIQRHIENIPKGSAIFFELKHSKPKKKRRSTKCFAFMEKNEFKEGPACIELYKKPTNFKREKLRLLTEKPLYLHLDISISK